MYIHKCYQLQSYYNKLELYFKLLINTAYPESSKTASVRRERTVFLESAGDISSFCIIEKTVQWLIAEIIYLSIRFKFLLMCHLDSQSTTALKLQLNILY